MQEIQDKIDGLHLKQLDETRKLALESNVKKNEIFAARTEYIKEHGPKDFWFQVFKAHPDFSSELLGEYDENIFAKMESFSVVNKSNGVRIEMKFAPNDYFTNDVLFFEEIEEPGKPIELKTSGINWKEGKGPSDSDNQQQQPSNPWAAAAAVAAGQQPAKESGVRREREAEGRGMSFFTFFETIPEVPQQNNNNNGSNDDGFDDFGDEGFGDNDAFADLLDEYDEMIEEKRDIARCICDEIWDNPAKYLKNK